MPERDWDDIAEEDRRRSYQEWRAGGGAGAFVRKDHLVRAYARHLLAGGEQPTRERIDAMLAETGRGYAVSPSYVSRALRGGPDGTWREFGGLRRPNGRRVEVEGRLHPSIRAAAEREGVAVETVRKRIAAGRPGWRYAD